MILQQVKKILTAHKRELTRKGVRALSIFGSIARDKGTAKSDVDILVDFDARKGLFFFVELKNYLEELLGREVDLVTKNALHPALKKRILQEAKHVF